MPTVHTVFRQLRERRLFQVAIVYLGAAWGLAQVTEFVVENYAISRRVLDLTVYLLVVGFPAALVIGWFHGRSGPQRPPKLEVALLSGVLLAAITGGWRIATAEGSSGRSLRLVDLGAASLGEGSVAVMPFTNFTSDASLAWLGPGVSDMLATNLAQLPNLRVVSSQRLFDLLRQEGNEAAAGQIPEALALDVAARSGAALLVWGSVLGRDHDLALDVKLIELHTGTVRAAERVRGGDVFVLVDSLARLLSGRLSGEPVEATELTPLAVATTPSLDAFKAYQQGLRAEWFFHLGEAREHYRRAVEMDSTFALALFRLGMLEGRQLNFGASIDYLERARRHARSPSERDRLFMDGFMALIRNDHPSAERLLTELVSKYPDDKEGRTWLSFVYGDMPGRAADRERVLREIVELDPYYAPAYNDLAYAAARRRDFVAAESLIARYVELAPEEPNPRDSRGEILEMAGRYEDARRWFREALDLREDFVVSLDHLARTWLREGQSAEARRELSAYLGSPSPDVRFEARLLIGDAHVAEGGFEAALRSYADAEREAAAAGRPDLRRKAITASALVALISGANAEALRLADSLFALDRFNQFALFVYAGALGEDGRVDELDVLGDRVSASLARSGDVASSFGRGLPELLDGMALHYAGEPEQAREAFRRARALLRAPDDAPLTVQEVATLVALGRGDEALPIARAMVRNAAAGTFGRYDPLGLALGLYFQARALELTGEREEAVESYEALLERWGPAVERVPFVSDAPQRLAALRG